MTVIGYGRRKAACCNQSTYVTQYTFAEPQSHTWPDRHRGEETCPKRALHVLDKMSVMRDRNSTTKQRQRACARDVFEIASSDNTCTLKNIHSALSNRTKRQRHDREMKGRRGCDRWNDRDDACPVSQRRPRLGLRSLIPVSHAAMASSTAETV